MERSCSKSFLVILGPSQSAFILFLFLVNLYTIMPTWSFFLTKESLTSSAARVIHNNRESHQWKLTVMYMIWCFAKSKNCTGNWFWGCTCGMRKHFSPWLSFLFELETSVLNHSLSDLLSVSETIPLFWVPST